MSHFGIAFLLLLPLCCLGDSCPERCQCFTASKVFCSEERIRSLPQNLSTEVKELIIMTTSIENVTPNSFPTFSKLTKVVFINNLLRRVSEAAFNSLVELEELEISGSQRLEEIGPNTFCELGNLTTLLLNHNKLNVLAVDLFSTLRKLETLQLKGNSMEELPKDLFGELHQLHHLDLSMNSILAVERDLFKALWKLETLRMNYNRIATLPPETLNQLPRLRELSLQGNRISGLHPTLFSQLGDLKKLNLQGNLISEIAPGMFPPGLQELNLKDNRLVALSPRTFWHLPSLTHLLLSKNQLTVLPTGLFQNLTGLTHLGLSQNWIASLPEAVFSGLMNLTAVHLQKNNISSLEAKLFEDQGNMEELYLSDNDLLSIPEGFFDHLTFLRTVRLHGNPWRCDHRLQYLHGWLANGSSDLVQDQYRLCCEEPSSLRGQAVVLLAKEHLTFAGKSCSLPQPKSNLPEHQGHGRPHARRCSIKDIEGNIFIECTSVGCPLIKLEAQFYDAEGHKMHCDREKEWLCSAECLNGTITL